MVGYIQTVHAPGIKHDSRLAAPFYDALQEIHCSGSEHDKENILDLTTPPTFYFYVAGGAELEALP
jgi:hypothetical protein